MVRLLGIETSCDETSASVVEGYADGDAQVRSLVIRSQDVHERFGGVVPEIASREHLTSLVPVVDRALHEAGATWETIDGIAVTHAPGLVGALLVGVAYAQGVSLARGLPVVGVHHMEGHLFATSLEDPAATPPFIALLVSGGHTLLLDVPAWGRYRLLGQTRDDAAGEAFDKAAKLLGLPYPGGRHLEALARQGTPGHVRFTPPMLRRTQRPTDEDYYAFSFSGLKTAVLLAVREATAAGTLADRAPDIAHGFQHALVTTLVEKSARAVEAFARPRLVLGGGVAGNRSLVEALTARLAPLGCVVHAPSPRLATDNAAMIARAGLFRFAARDPAGALSARASAAIPGLEPAPAAAP
ncbi:MAG: tRNA (adenosine(37)-N6)-threonylcarbamoyltransferase complex transferase subunit TsaD [Gemmatimonadaceae bacterium]|jgi:N6-L-threonylcarbamoyladenine synthase|nr:tRNA (adenosine(37)-N6)-threonylcarbamoyltransferase complex transferase subunit TsaD [Gemmatimonadaceae bacterium]